MSIITDPTRCEIRAVIRFLHAKKLRAADIHRQISEVYGPNVMSAGSVRKWCRAFNKDRTNICDENRSGRPTVANDKLIGRVNDKILENNKFTITELSGCFPQVSRTKLHEIVSERLQYQKIYTSWVPKTLTDSLKYHRTTSARNFLKRYEKDGDNFLKHIVTGDEMRISREMMVIVFWDQKGILFIEFLSENSMSSEVYCEILKKLYESVLNTRTYFSSIILLHESSRANANSIIGKLLENFKWEVFDHPPFSPDLAPSDFYFFSHMRKFMSSRRFTDEDNLKNAINSWINKLTTTFFEEGLKKLVSQYEKCLFLGGEYIEE